MLGIVKELKDYVDIILGRYDEYKEFYILETDDENKKLNKHLGRLELLGENISIEGKKFDKYYNRTVKWDEIKKRIEETEKSILELLVEISDKREFTKEEEEKYTDYMFKVRKYIYKRDMKIESRKKYDKKLSEEKEAKEWHDKYSGNSFLKIKQVYKEGKIYKSDELEEKILENQQKQNDEQNVIDGSQNLE